MDDYKKVMHVWDESKQKIHVQSRLNLSSVEDETMDLPINAVAEVMASLMDRSYLVEIALSGAEGAARNFISGAGDYFKFELSW